MREILFRGKCVDNGEWVYGLLCRVGDTYANIVEKVEKSTEVMCTVLTNTIGQYTGLTDKNGKKIFEEDIVKCEIGLTATLHRVVFENRNGKAYFGVAVDKYGTLEFCHLLPPNRFEVVGNIHDNPELLEVTE